MPANQFTTVHPRSALRGKEDPHFAGQENVFDNLGTDVLDNAFAGFNACIFAYGQTGSGKTYTMMGTKTDPGLIPRLCTNLYDRMGENTDKNVSFKVEVSYMEIYNEKVKDLLSVGGQKKNLKVREHKVLGPFVEGLTRLAVSGYDSIKTLMDEGNKNRSVAKTNMNDESSRSHAVFTLFFTQATYDEATKQTGERVSRISLVDLAGSERHSKTGTTGDRLKEGANINKSLTNLGLCISALAKQAEGGASKGSKGGKGKKKEEFVPYRNSVLTLLLKDNLGGNAKTVMVATLSPASDNFEETLSTLRYADNAKKIVNKAIVNEDPNARLIRELREELERLRSQVGGVGGMGEGAPSGAEALLLKERLAETEGMLADLNKTWEEKLAESEMLLKEHLKLLESHGASIGQADGQSGLQIEAKLPHFVSLSQELDFRITIYSLKQGETRIGRDGADPPQDIVIWGKGVEQEHCIVRYAEQFEPSENRIREVVELLPIGLCFVNGQKVEDPVELKQGQVVQFGHSTVFRFNHPTEAERMRQLREQGLLPEAEDSSEGGAIADTTFLRPGQILENLQKEKEAEIEAKEAALAAEKQRLDDERLKAEADALCVQQDQERREREWKEQAQRRAEEDRIEADRRAREVAEAAEKKAAAESEAEALRKKMQQMEALMKQSEEDRRRSHELAAAEHEEKERALKEAALEKAQITARASDLEKIAEEERKLREAQNLASELARKEFELIEEQKIIAFRKEQDVRLRTADAERLKQSEAEHRALEEANKKLDETRRQVEIEKARMAREMAAEREKVLQEHDKVVQEAKVERARIEAEVAAMKASAAVEKEKLKEELLAKEKAAQDAQRADAERRIKQTEEQLKRYQEAAAREKTELEERQRQLQQQMKIKDAEQSVKLMKQKKELQEERRVREREKADREREKRMASRKSQEDDPKLVEQKKQDAIKKAKEDWMKRIGVKAPTAGVGRSGQTASAARSSTVGEMRSDLNKQQQLREQARLKATKFKEELQQEKALKQEQEALAKGSQHHKDNIAKLSAQLSNVHQDFGLNKPPARFDATTASWSGKKDDRGKRRTSGDIPAKIEPVPLTLSPKVSAAKHNPFAAPKTTATGSNNPFGSGGGSTASAVTANPFGSPAARAGTGLGLPAAASAAPPAADPFAAPVPEPIAFPGAAGPATGGADLFQSPPKSLKRDSQPEWNTGGGVRGSADAEVFDFTKIGSPFVAAPASTSHSRQGSQGSLIDLQPDSNPFLAAVAEQEAKPQAASLKPAGDAEVYDFTSGSTTATKAAGAFDLFAAQLKVRVH